VNRLHIFRDTTKIAELIRLRGGRLKLSYVDGLELSSPLVSVNLPTQPKPYRGDNVAAFFNGLLPEGEARRIIGYDLGIDANDIFEMLRAIGAECAGALSITPEDPPPRQRPPDQTNPILTDDEIAYDLSRLHITPFGGGDEKRISLAGVQEKLLLTKTPDGWTRPTSTLASTHLVKRRISLFPDTIPNEAACLELARKLGIRTTDSEICTFGNEQTLVIDRFDRHADRDGTIKRTHQEDLCQAIGLNPNDKYQRDREHPSLNDAASVLRDWGEPGELLHLFDQTLLTVLVGNADAHAKNISFLHTRPGFVQLAPAYDVMSLTQYDDHTPTLGLRVNGVADANAVTLADVIAEGARWGLPSTVLRDRAAARIEQVPAALSAAITRANPRQKMIDTIDANYQRLARAISIASTSIDT